MMAGVSLRERGTCMSLRAKLAALWIKRRPKHVSATQIIALTFAVVILVGALLLTLPADSARPCLRQPPLPA